MTTSVQLSLFGTTSELDAHVPLEVTSENCTVENANPTSDDHIEAVSIQWMPAAELPADIKQARWNQLLNEAIRQPGMLHQCYSKFYQYSIGNLMLAAWQLLDRGIEFGPLATFEQWKHKYGRHVKKGEKAIAMWMPMSVYVKEKDDNGNEVKTDRKRTIFVAKSQWFTLAQTEGEELPPVQTPDWSIEQALAELKIKQIAFDPLLVGVNCQGYATKRNIAINPACEKMLATQLHEIAHVTLGHTDKEQLIADGRKLTRSIMELEAESTAMICLDALGFNEYAVYNRGYIQHWMQAGGVTEIPEDSAKRIFSAADKILKAGQVKAVVAQAA